MNSPTEGVSETRTDPESVASRLLNAGMDSFVEFEVGRRH